MTRLPPRSTAQAWSRTTSPAAGTRSTVGCSRWSVGPGAPRRPEPSLVQSYGNRRGGGQGMGLQVEREPGVPNEGPQQILFPSEPVQFVREGGAEHVQV